MQNDTLTPHMIARIYNGLDKRVGYPVIEPTPKHFDQADKSCYDHGCTDDCPVANKPLTTWQKFVRACGIR